MRTKEEYLIEAEKWLNKINIDKWSASACESFAIIAQTNINMANAVDKKEG